MRRLLIALPFVVLGLGLATPAQATGRTPQPAQQPAQRPACAGCWPDIEVRLLPSLDGLASADTFNMGSTPQGTPLSFEFEIGAGQFFGELSITDITVPAGFSIASEPTSPIADGTWQAAEVVCDAVEPGVYIGDISITSDDQDVDENPFTIQLTCEVTAVEEDDASDTTGPTDDAGSGAGIPTTGSSSTTLMVLAGGLLAVGASVRVAARRRA